MNNFDYLSTILSQQPHYFNGERKAAYMASTYHLFINELLRKTDPKQRTLEKFIDEEIAKPLNIMVIQPIKSISWDMKLINYMI